MAKERTLSGLTVAPGRDDAYQGKDGTVRLMAHPEWLADGTALVTAILTPKAAIELAASLLMVALDAQKYGKAGS